MLGKISCRARHFFSFFRCKQNLSLNRRAESRLLYVLDVGAPNERRRPKENKNMVSSRSPCFLFVWCAHVVVCCCCFFSCAVPCFGCPCRCGHSRLRCCRRYLPTAASHCMGGPARIFLVWRSQGDVLQGLPRHDWLEAAHGVFSPPPRPE